MQFILTTVSHDGKSVTCTYTAQELEKFDFLQLAATLKSLTIEAV